MQTLNNNSSFGFENSNFNEPMFFGKSLGIARYDKMKYPQIDKITEKMLGFFWRPEEVNLSKDTIDFKNLNSAEKRIFTSNIKRQIILDSIQGRAPSTVLLPHVSLPELEPAIQTWAFFETIHSKSYTHILRNIYSNPSEIFDDILTENELLHLAINCSHHYDNFSENPCYKNLVDLLTVINALEGIRFYVSFACSWAFAETKRMEGNAKIIKFIARDENLHLALTTQIIKLLLKDDSEFRALWNYRKDKIYTLFQSVLDQEKKWATYLFHEGSMLGLNESLLHSYIDYITCKRMKALDLEPFVNIKNNPLPWTEKWINGGDVQVAPQETEISSYTIGNINNNITPEFLKQITL